MYPETPINSPQHITRNLLLIWLALLLVLPLAVYFLAGETSVVIGNQGGAVWAEVHGTRLDVPADAWDLSQAGRLKLPGTASIQIAPLSSSQYWQPTQPDIAPAIGDVGEWLQLIQLPPRWTSAQVGSDGTASYSIKAGRSLELIPLDDGSGNGLVLQLRAEKAAIAWWTLVDGQPGQQLSSTGYRPSGLVSTGDVLSEVTLLAWVGTLLVGLVWLLGIGIARLQRRRVGRLSVPRDGVELGDTDSPRKRTGVERFLHMSRQEYPAVALFLAGTVLAAAVCLSVLEGIPHVQDEVSYLFQGKIFALLHFWVPEPPAPEFFQSSFIERLDGRWFSKYPPGYPLLLMPAIWAGVPWLVNALSCGAALAFTYLAGLRMFGQKVAAWAGLFGLVSPWVLFMSGSYMSHPTTMMWAALFMLSLVGIRSGHEAPKLRIFGPAYGWAVIGGFAIGMAFITREWTALGIGLGGAVWGVWDILSGPGKLRKLASYTLVVVGFLPPLFMLLYENYALTGDFFRLAQDLVGSYDTPGFGPGHGSPEGHTPALGVYNGLVYLRTLATVFNGWPAPFALAPMFLGLFAWAGDRVKKVLAWDALVWLLLAGLVVAYFFWWSSTTIYGPRYWYEGLPFMLLMAGRGMDLLGKVSARALEGVWAERARWLVPGALFALFTLYNLTQTLPAEAHVYSDYNDVTGEAVEQVEHANLKSAVVFVALEPSRPDRDYGKVFFANDPLLQGDVIYARDRGPANNAYLVSRLPGRVPYYLPLEGPPKPGVGP